jgi:beta-glucosidase
MSRIETLIASMTLAEKLGQLTMTAASFTVTGPVIAGDSTGSIRSGEIGNLLNMVGPGPVRAVQRLAVEESRLKIPLLIGLDIIHGHRSLFPVPLAEAVGGHRPRSRHRRRGRWSGDDLRPHAGCVARSALGSHGGRLG